MAAKRKVGRPKGSKNKNTIIKDKEFISNFNARAITPFLTSTQIDLLAKSFRIHGKYPYDNREFLEEFSTRAIVNRMSDKSISALANKLRERY